MRAAPDGQGSVRVTVVLIEIVVGGSTAAAWAGGVMPAGAAAGTAGAEPALGTGVTGAAVGAGEFGAGVPVEGVELAGVGTRVIVEGTAVTMAGWAGTCWAQIPA